MMFKSLRFYGPFTDQAFTWANFSASIQTSPFCSISTFFVETFFFLFGQRERKEGSRGFSFLQKSFSNNKGFSHSTQTYAFCVHFNLNRKQNEVHL